VNAVSLAAGSSGISNINAFLSASNLGNFQAVVAFAQNTITASVRDAPDAAAAPAGIPVPINVAANATRFATLRFAEPLCASPRQRLP
jgi:hypothetical protein